MLKAHKVDPSEYTSNATIAAAVEAVNRAGLQEITTRTQKALTSVPMSVVMPLEVDASFGELAGSTGVAIQYAGFANREDLPDRLVSMTLASTALKMPIIGMPYPNRNWRGGPQPEYRWRRFGGSENVPTSMALLDGYSELSLTAAQAGLSLGKVHFLGSSMGAAQVLSAANMARRTMDVGAVSAVALPNNEQRQVYAELLLRDFRKGFDHARREASAATSDGTQVDPLLEAFGVSDKTKGVINEIRTLGRYVILDIFGSRLQNYDSNMACARSISVPSSVPLLERLNSGDNPVTTHLGFFAQDPVARIEPFLTAAAGRSLDNTTVDIYPDKTHSSCVNPLIGAYFALKLLD